MGMPLVAGVTDALNRQFTPAKLQVFNRHWTAHGTGYPSMIFDAFLRVWATPGMHYEAKIGWLQREYMKGNGAAARHFYNLHIWLIEQVGQTLLRCHFDNEAQMIASARNYGGLKQIAEREMPLWVFSLNHDLCVEIIGAENGFRVQGGFPPRVVDFPCLDRLGCLRGRIGFRQILHEELVAGRFEYIPDGEPGLNLVKLHGALDTYLYTDDHHLLQICPAASSGAAWIGELRRIEEGEIYRTHADRTRAVNEISVADDAGEIQFLRRTLLSGAFKFGRRIAQNAPPELLTFFANKIRELNRLVVIGYGFGDEHMNRLIEAWLSDDRSRQLLYVSPTGSRPQLLDQFGLQVSVRNMTAVQFIETDYEVAFT